MPPNLVLGLCDGHDSGACVVRDGELLAAVSSERFSGVKRQPGFPWDAARWCLRQPGVRGRTVQRVAVAERAGRAALRLLDRWYRGTEPSLPLDRVGNLASMGWQNLVSRGALAPRLEAALSAAVLQRRVRRLGLTAPVTLVDHHLAHAASAAHGSGMQRALVVTMDAFGDGSSGSLWRWRGGRLAPLLRIPFPHSPALLYGMVTCLLGYREGDEGKVSGLAANGNPAATVKVLERTFEATGESLRLRRIPTMRWLRRALGQHHEADIAAGLQLAIQQLVAPLVARWMERSGERQLCLAGGLFANVRLNQAVAEASGCTELYVFPHMGDGGLCAGAAWAVQQSAARRGGPASIFVGPREEPLPALARTDELGLARRPLDEKGPERVAQLLAHGGVVGLVSGNMEFGPRALGNRSLLFSATEPSLAAELGLALGRPSMMPFCPVLRRRDLERLAAGPVRAAMQFMTVTASALPGVAGRFPTAVHADGSMRVQLATRQTTPLLYDILTHYKQLHDPPLLINTSFNEHREPIIRTASRALELFSRLPLLAGLVIGEQLVVKQRTHGP